MPPGMQRVQQCGSVGLAGRQRVIGAEQVMATKRARQCFLGHVQRLGVGEDTEPVADADEAADLPVQLVGELAQRPRERRLLPVASQSRRDLRYGMPSARNRTTRTTATTSDAS